MTLELGAAKAGTSRPGRGRWAGQVSSLRDGAAEATATQTSAPHSQFYHPLSFQQRRPVLIGEDAHVIPPSVGPRDRPEQQDQSCQGNHKTPQVRHVSRSPSLSAFPLHLPAAAPLPLWRPLRSCAQGASQAREPHPLPASNSVRMSGPCSSCGRWRGKAGNASISELTTEEALAGCGPSKSPRRGGRRRDQGDALEMSDPVVPTSA
jgi:hypothetical protein